MLVTQESEYDLEFIPPYLRATFENVVLEWYEGFCTWKPGLIPKPALFSLSLLNTGFINEDDEILVHEVNLSWLIGAIIERYSDDPGIEGASMLDLSIAEGMAVERDIRRILDKKQMVYIDEQNQLKNDSILGVW